MRKFNLISIGIYTTFAGSFAYANTLPNGENITHGTATIERANNAMTINQSSNVVSIDWNSFDIGAQNSVEFKQPTSLSIAHNRVTGGNASEIQGKLTANGRVFLSNPNGVIFSKTAEVNVGALLATTKELENTQSNLEQKNFRFIRKKTEEGEIKNQGKITANGQNGFIALVGDKVKNEGELNGKSFSETKKETRKVCTGWSKADCENEYIRDYYGYKWIEREYTENISTPAQIILASGESFTVDIPDRVNAVDIVLDANTMANIVENNGAIIAENGYIELTAKGQEKALNSAVNNNGILQATTASVRNGKITLTAENINLGEKSHIEAQKALEFTSPHSSNTVKIHSQKGSKILAEETNIKVKKLDFSGEFERAESETSNFYSSGTGKQSNKFSVELEGKITIGDEKKSDNAGNFIGNSALASMLGGSGKVTLNSKLFSDPITDQLNYGGFEWTGNFKLNTFKNSDALLSLSTRNGVDIKDANIQAETGRLRIATHLNDYKTGKFPDTVKPEVNIKNSTLDLGNGAIGIGRTGRNFDYVQQYYFEDERRSYFDVNLDKVELKNIDDFVVMGGMGNVNFNDVSHTGRSNFYIHGGNERLFGKQKVWEYAIKDLEERISRSEKNHDCQRCRRWTFSADLDEVYIPREFLDTYDSWIVAENRQHLDTNINMTNTNLNIKDGFLHLMAKNINLKDSNINIDFDRDLSYDTLHSKIHKLGLNGNTVLDNTHISVKGAEKASVSPDKEFGIASFFSIGDMTGKNKSSIFVKSNDGYTVRTNGGATWKGENGKDDLDVKILNLGIAYDPKKYENGFSITADYPELGNVGLSMAATPAAVKLENLTLKIVAPNGAPAYHSSENLKFETKNADFSYFERPRTQKQNEATIVGDTTKLDFTEDELTRELNVLNGVPEPVPAEEIVTETAPATNDTVEHTTDNAYENNVINTNSVTNNIAHNATNESIVSDNSENETGTTSTPTVTTDVASHSFEKANEAQEKSRKATEESNILRNSTVNITSPNNHTLYTEKEIKIDVCVEGEECKAIYLGDKHSDARVNVGEVN
ncbi:two-partner secretion domain-containing protein [Ursidibacter sp. B-7004-1]